MASFYDRADLYDLFEDDKRYDAYKRHWEIVFQGKDIHNLLDVSIGSGSVTMPVLDLGVDLYGSDLSQAMLARCRDKIAKRHPAVAADVESRFRQTDFRDLSSWGNQQFDMVCSTGNSLAYVSNDDVLTTLEQMSAHVKPGGYLYVDSRNWKSILETRQRFYLYNPMFRDDNRINVMQVWDYHTDGSMIFNILYTIEKENRILQKEIFEEHYYPFDHEILLQKLQNMGYEDIQLYAFPSFLELKDFPKAEWYTVTARRSAR